MLYCVSLALSFSCLVYVFVFVYFVALYWLAVAEFAFFRVYMVEMVVLLLLFPLPPDGLLLCDHELDFFWDQLM